MNIPTALIGLTLIYWIFVGVVDVVSTKDCLLPPCNSEGLDDTIIGWTTDFFIGAGMIGLGIHLFVQKRFIQGSAIRSLLSIGVVYILGGIGHGWFSNSGSDDGTGMLEFFVLWAFAYAVTLYSIGETYRFVWKVTDYLNFKPSSCLKNSLLAAFAMVAITCLALVFSHSWCASQTHIHADGLDDDILVSDNIVFEECLVINFWAEGLHFGALPIFWTLVGVSLRKLLLDHEPVAVVGGLQSTTAALWLSIVPWFLGSGFILWVFGASIVLGEDSTDLYGKVYGAAIYHYGTLLTYFLFHNAVLSIPQQEKSELPSTSISSQV